MWTFHTVFLAWIYLVGSDMTLKDLKLGSDQISLELDHSHLSRGRIRLEVKRQ